MFNNRQRGSAFWGTIIGTSLGIVLSSRVSPLNRKRMAKTARKVGSNLRNGMSSLWR